MFNTNAQPFNGAADNMPDYGQGDMGQEGLPAAM
jgi:hypothetical protein